MLPKAHVAVAGRSDPVPADAAILGHVAKDLAIASTRAIGAGKAVELLVNRIAGEVQRMNPHGDRIGPLQGNGLRHIEAESAEHAHHRLRIGHLPAVQPDVGPVVDPVEVQPYGFAAIRLRQLEFGAEPIRLGPGVGLVRQMAVLGKVVAAIVVVAGVGDAHVVHADVGIGINAVTHERAQRGRGNRRCVPLGRVESGLRKGHPVVAGNRRFAHLPIGMEDDGAPAQPCSAARHRPRETTAVRAMSAASVEMHARSR